MSHTTTTYPISTLGDDAPWLMREEESGYRPFPRGSSTSTWSTKSCPRPAQGASLLLNRPHEQPEQTLIEPSVIITNLIADVMLAHKAREADYYREQEGKRNK